MNTKTRVIEVAEPFILTTDEGKRIPFGLGQHTVSESVAEHWYVKLHLKKDGPPALGDHAFFVALDRTATEAENHAKEQRRLADEAWAAYEAKSAPSSMADAGEEEGGDADDGSGSADAPDAGKEDAAPKNEGTGTTSARKQRPRLLKKD